MNSADARRLMVERLTARYGTGEANAITRIVFEDVFARNPVFDAARFEEILARLDTGEPVQYVLGQADFWGLKFVVNQEVLIPRQETEELVAWALDLLRNMSEPAPKVLDIGLGSGCIGITLKKKWPAIELFGLEKSIGALEIARENARRILGAQHTAQLLQGDVLVPDSLRVFPMLDMIVSNPPYIPQIERSLVPGHVAAFEPELALFVADEDPLLFYRVIAAIALEKLHPGGCLLFECNEFNAGQVAEHLRQQGFTQVELRRDLAGADRMVLAKKPN